MQQGAAMAHSSPSFAVAGTSAYDPLAGKRLLDQAKLDAHNQRLHQNADETAFDSLRPKSSLSEQDRARATRLLAEAAVRRLKRWSDPKTDGLDDGDRDGLMRQGEVFGLSPL